MPLRRPPPRLSTLIVMTAVSLLSLNLFLPSLASMARDFGTEYAIINISVAGYLAVSAGLQLVMGPLSDRYGRRPVLLTGLALFTAASLGCLLATNVWVFLAFRMMQAAIVSASVLSRAIIADMYDKQTAASLMGYVAMVMAVAPMMGPMAGGILEELIHWRASFAVYLVCGAGLLLTCWIDVGETNQHPSETFAAQFRAYPELLRSRRFWGYSLCTAFSVGTFFIFLGGAPLAASAAFGMSPAALGVGMGCTTAGFFFGNMIASRLSKRFELSQMMTAGRLVTLAGLLTGAALLAGGMFHAVTFFGSVVSVGIGNGLSLPAGNAGAMAVRPRLAGSASGLSGAMQVGGGAALTVLAGVLVTEENGIAILMALLIACAFAGLLTALYVMRLDRMEPLPETA